MLILYELTRGRGDRNLMHLLIDSINIHCCKHKQTVRITLRIFNKVEILIWNSEVLRCWVVYDQQMTLQSSKQSYSTETELIAIDVGVGENSSEAQRKIRTWEHSPNTEEWNQINFGNFYQGLCWCHLSTWNTMIQHSKSTAGMRTLLPFARLINEWKEKNTEMTFTHRSLNYIIYILDWFLTQMAIQTTQWQHLSALKVDLIFKASTGTKKEGDWSYFLHGEPGELLWLFPNLLISRDFQRVVPKKKETMSSEQPSSCVEEGALLTSGVKGQNE